MTINDQEPVLKINEIKEIKDGDEIEIINSCIYKFIAIQQSDWKNTIPPFLQIRSPSHTHINFQSYLT